MITVEELLALLNDLPIEALKKPIFIEEAAGFEDVVIEPVTESCDDDTIVGYVITEKKEEDE